MGSQMLNKLADCTAAFDTKKSAGMDGRTEARENRRRSAAEAGASGIIGVGYRGEVSLSR